MGLNLMSLLVLLCAVPAACGAWAWRRIEVARCGGAGTAGVGAVHARDDESAGARIPLLEPWRPAQSMSPGLSLTPRHRAQSAAPSRHGRRETAS